MDSQPEGFECTLVEIAVGNWVRLLRCSVCKQLWRIDALDKYQTQFAAKIPDIDSWQTYDSVPAIKQLLIQSRGGLSSNICQWAHCSQNAINGVAFCIDHLFDTGVRI